MSDTGYLLLFGANLAFIVTHLYGWLLKWFYRPTAYREHFHELFPAQRAVGFIYLLQLFEVPYLLQVGDGDALLYVNAFSLLFFSIQMLIMCERYFFPQERHRSRDLWIVLLAVVVLVPLFLQAVHLVRLPSGWRVWCVGGVSLVFLFFFVMSVVMALRIRRAVQRANEERYADSEDFPVDFANIIRWVPTFVLVLLAINFYADNVWVKFGRDLLFIVLNVWFCILTLNPWRKASGALAAAADAAGASEEATAGVADKAEGGTAFRLSEARFDDLARRLDDLLQREQIFTEPHITSDLLMQRLGTNANYLSEVIRRSGYQSFYDMISQHRVRHAISLIQREPDRLLQDIADACGFSSPASMTKSFKAQGKEPPSRYRR
ncbi:MAG: AraC family transcriptional regulator [Bacteroidales bacterium]|nr:AraC family transcriptional regulator [Bacteroidales bacterium]